MFFQCPLYVAYAPTCLGYNSEQEANCPAFVDLIFQRGEADKKY